ncbi:MAG: peptide ABC transporter substrate-binding protein [Candidatus Hadarchaeum sp.]
MFQKRFAVLVTLLLALAMVLSSCKPAEKLAKQINLNHGTEPPTLDPNLATDTTSVQCDFLLFMGLTKPDIVTVEPKPWLAKEWSVSADGLVWTFKMRNDIYWVHWDPATQKAEKKRPVTAHDIVYSVRRVANPETASDYAYVDYIIKGVEAVNTGESTDLESIGVRAVDDYTVEFTLNQPAGYFGSIAGMWTNYPVPREVIEEHGDKWTEPGNIWTCGPYVLDVWEHENKMVMKKNPFWFDAKNVSIEQINWVMVTDDATAFAMYENGELDVAGVPLADMDRVKADPVLSKELKIAPVLCTYYYGFNTTKPPFDNPKVRQAFSYAMDRQKLIDTVLKGEQKPAKTFACPGIFGSPATDPKFEGITFNPEKARALLAEAGYPEGKGLPEITLMFNTSAGHQKIAEFFQANWKEVLGVEVKLANQEWKVYLKTVTEDAPQIWRLGWCADYADENNWVLEVFHPTKGANNPKWSGPDADEFARLTEQAAAESDPKKRAELYFQAEKILCVDSAVIAPIYYYTRVTCTKPYVERTFGTQGGMEEIWTWKVKAH